MVITKRKKVVKYRAHTTHGGGHRKKRRGAGSRGGRGRAGSGKRAGQKKAGGIFVITGKGGFRPRRDVAPVVPVNVGHFTLQTVEKLVAKGKAVKDGDSYSIDLSLLGYTKLLGAGNPTVKLNLSVSQYSSRAEEKIKAAGGRVESLQKPGKSAKSGKSGKSETTSSKPAASSESDPTSESE